ncbi:MAG TPA: RNA polymerase sigma factor [Candidatus Elarobacter sp.]|nr:RNA polymerase sigma factor [Candidatus Elarobacter sp.]HEV2739105.1 RNA polymerase sigma factor [Candidatus Elarobacter sp.]
MISAGSQAAPSTSSRAGSTRRIIFETDEDKVASGFCARDQRALSDVYRLYAANLYAVAARVLGVKQDAEDCVHDTLLRLWSTPNAYRKERGPLRSLLVVAVRNDALSRRRSAARHRTIEQRAGTPVVEADFTAELRDHVECAKLRAALEALTADLREPIVRAYMNYQTHNQISKDLNVPLGTIKSRLIIALRKLHEELTAEKQRA